MRPWQELATTSTRSPGAPIAETKSGEGALTPVLEPRRTWSRTRRPAPRPSSTAAFTALSISARGRGAAPVSRTLTLATAMSASGHSGAPLAKAPPSWNAMPAAATFTERPVSSGAMRILASFSSAPSAISTASSSASVPEGANTTSASSGVEAVRREQFARDGVGEAAERGVGRNRPRNSVSTRSTRRSRSSAAKA